MDLVGLILSCAFTSIDDSLLHSLALQQSGGTPFYVRAYRRPEGLDYKDATRASEAVERLLERTEGAYVGLMGVPVDTAATYDVGPRELLNACDNVRVASVMLADFRADCDAEEAADVTGCTLIRYGEATGHPGEYFAENVIFGAITTVPDDADKTEAEQVSDVLVFEEQRGDSAGDSLHFNLDLDDLANNSESKIAEELANENE